MDTNNAMGRYKKIDIVTASQDKLIVMLYDGAILYLENAIKSIDKKHGTEDAHNNIVKAQDIIYELSSSLNFDAGDIAHRLSSIYIYMNKRLSEANISKEKKPIIEIIDHLKELRVAWASVVSKNSATNTTNNKPKDGTSKLDVVG